MNENKDFRMAPSNCRDFLSIVKYIGYLAKEEFSIKIEGKCLNFKPVKNVCISPLFFRKGACRRCGCCCKKGITNAYTESEVEKIKNVYQYEKNIPLNKITGGTDVRWLITNRIVKLKDLVDNLKEYNVDIIRRDNLIDNEVIKKSFWVFNKFHQDLRCNFVELYDVENNIFRCIIHDLKPTHCRMPLIRVNYYKNSDTTILTKREFGFKWQFGCPIEFEKFDIQELINIDIPVLKSLEQNSKDLGINTYLPEIISQLNLLVKNNSINFYNKKVIKIFPEKGIQKKFF